MFSGETLRLFGFISFAIISLAYVPYIRDIFRGKTKPERTSWFIWSILGKMGSATIYAILSHVPRIERVDVGGYVYHVLNRANARVRIFDSPKDYQQFEEIMEEAVERFTMRLLAYCIMPNHWHFVLYPAHDGDMSQFMGWLTNTHTRRWHTTKRTIGQGHLYQGRYKSFLIQEDNHFLTVVRYVERNAKRANLVGRAEEWKWSSVFRRENGSDDKKKMLSPWPVPTPKNYLEWLNKPQIEEEEKAIRRCIVKNMPFGDVDWLQNTVQRFGLGQTLRGVGRPKSK